MSSGDGYGLGTSEELADVPSFPKKAKHEDSEGVWLISYSDLMTLLMGFFALLLSMSNLDSKKSSEIQESATKYFGGDVKKPFASLAKNLRDIVKENKLEKQIQITDDFSSVTVAFKGTVLFSSGSVALSPAAESVLEKMIPIIKQNAGGYHFLIEGHTDNVPITHPYISSNWELSGMRAATVARKLESHGFRRDHMMVVGWSDTRPLSPNVDEGGKPIPENQDNNRRITLKILREPAM